MIVILDGYCKFCRRMGEYMGKFTKIGDLTVLYSDMEDARGLMYKYGMGDSIDNIVGIVGNYKVVEGVYCWREILKRIPVFWWFVWIMYIPGCMNLVAVLYEVIKNNRYRIMGCDGSCRAG